MPPLLASRYHLNQRLGGGGMGDVFAATDVLTDTPVAVKRVRPRDRGDATLRARFLREGRNALRLVHPHIVRTLDAGEDDDGPWLVMERLDGCTLAAHVEAHGPLAPNVAAAWLGQVTDALAHAHALGVVHRDLKPANVMVCGTPGDERLVLLDFGLARDLAQPIDAVTAHGVAVGTPAWMAPEQRAGLAVDARADVFSLAAVAAWMLTGRLPLAAWGRPFACAMFGSPRPWPDDVDAVLDGALAVDPDARITSVTAFHDALAPALRSWASRDVSLRPHAALGLHDVSFADAPADAPTQPWQPHAITLPDAPPDADEADADAPA